MSKIYTDPDEILRMINEMSDFDEDEVEDNVEVEELKDPDDSDEDPDYIPDEAEIEEEFNNNICQIEEESTQKRKQIKINVTEPRVREITSDFIITLDNQELVGKDGYRWKTSPPVWQGKTCKRNIIYTAPGPNPIARQCLSPLDCFSLFMTDDILSKIVGHTNEEISIERDRYKQSGNSSLMDTSSLEINALFGLLILSAALKNNHLTTEMLFDESYSGSRFKSTMSRTRFNFLVNCVRFDNKTTRKERQALTKLAPISEIWDIFRMNCKKSYNPGSYVTIDEQLIGFRGRCPFRMYIPSKPNKYGIKLVMMCDNSTKYMIDAIPYLGKGTVPNGKPAAEFFVEELLKSIKGSNRNITFDNWFASIPLAKKMLEMKLTVIATIKKNKRELPREFVDEKYQGRKSGSCLFLFDDDMTLLSYKPKPNKLVTMISTAHKDGTINKDSNKPEIVMNYNSTKGGVDTFDQMTQNMCCNRKTKRWPLCFFYNMLNISTLNSFVIYTHNNYKIKLRPLNRLRYMLKLSDELIAPWLKIRYALPNINSDLRLSIGKLLNQPVETAPNPSQKGSRTYCSYCSYTKKRMTTTYCARPGCSKPICGEHQKKMCFQCTL